MAAITAAAIGIGAAEALSRAAVRHRAAQLLGEVAVTTGRTVHIPARPVLATLPGGRVDEIVIRAETLRLPTLALQDVALHLRDVRLTRSGRIADGVGYLDGHVPAREVLRLAGVRGALELREGTLTFRWPAPRTGVPSLGLRLRPRLGPAGVRLAPTPISIPLPPLPPGTTLTSVQAEDDALLVTATIDLRLLFGDM